MSKSEKGDPTDPSVVFMVGGLKARRVVAGMSQRKVAKKLGVKKRLLRKWEEHKVEPSLRQIQQWARVFETKLTPDIKFDEPVYEPVGWRKGAELGLGRAENSEEILYQKVR